MNDPKNKERNNDQSSLREESTLHTTDPQENMEGPVSSTIKDTGEAFDSDETQEEADREKEKNL